ncbi:MAG: hypothetical protein QM800_03355 [Paludibacter sp.]
MNPVKIEKKQFCYLIPIILVYITLTIISANYCYFWDNIQQITKEAHWFYLNDFTLLLMPSQNSGAEIVATGYHPPLMGMMTAILWKVFGYKLWVSHIFGFFWFFILIYNIWKIAKRFFKPELTGWLLAIVLLESTLLTQFTIASPDFILFTAFILSLRAILEHKNILLAIGIFFLCTINMRGLFVGSALFISHLYYTIIQSDVKIKVNKIIKLTIPYLPTLIILLAYFSYYFASRGWFFSNSGSDGHYSLPQSLSRVIKHIAEFGLRSIENGRIFIWIIGTVVAYQTWRRRIELTNEQRFLFTIFLLLSGLYILFIFITQMPFSARYFMPQFFILAILTLSGIQNLYTPKVLKLTYILILAFEITGNLWIYPGKMAKSWDCTLAHLPYYELREQCFSYIDQNKLDYTEISAGFCLYGSRQFIELKTDGKTIGSDPNSKFFIYSNISNLDDNFVVELEDRKIWEPLKVFEKGFVKIIIYKRITSV